MSKSQLSSGRFVPGYDSPEAWAAHLDSLGPAQMVAERRRKWDYHLKGLVEGTLDFDALRDHVFMREALQNVMRPWAAQIEAVQADHDVRLEHCPGGDNARDDQN